MVQILVNIGSGNGLVPSGTKPSPEPILSDVHTEHAPKPMSMKTNDIWDTHDNGLNRLPFSAYNSYMATTWQGDTIISLIQWSLGVNNEHWVRYGAWAHNKPKIT